MMTKNAKMANALIKILNGDGLKAVYEQCCEEYRHRINEQWQLDVKDSWWVVDRKGDVLCLNDMEFSLGMDDVRYFVDEGITYDEFIKWWDYNLDEFHKGDKGKQINVYSWFGLGCRPEDLDKEKPIGHF